jgi:signal transduction histidine kinase
MIEQIISNAIKYSKSETQSKSIFFIIKQNDNITTLEIKDEGIV